MRLDKIKANPSNPRVIRDDKFNKLVKSIQQFPAMMEKRPIVVDETMTVLGGNMRLRALQHIYGKGGDIPDAWVVVAEGWTEEQKREFVIKDNAAFGEWDWDALSQDFNADDLADWGIDVPLENFANPDDFGDEFSLPDGARSSFCTMTFTLAGEQQTIIENALKDAKNLDEFKYIETMGNTNSNGNALYLIVQQWADARK